MLRPLTFSIVFYASCGVLLNNPVQSDEFWVEFDKETKETLKKFMQEAMSLIFSGKRNVEGNAFATMVEMVRKYIIKNEEKILANGDCFYTKTMTSMDGCDKNETIGDIAAMLFASLDATSITIEFSLLVLCKFPAIQTLLYNDICKAFENDNRNDNSNDINSINDIITTIVKTNKLDNLKAFLFEVLRKYPAAHTTAPRRALKDIVIRIDDDDDDDNDVKYIIPKDYAFSINIIGINNNIKYWKNRNGNEMEFDLNRWLNDENKFVKSKSFVNFGLGSRNCVGQYVGLRSIYCALIYLIYTYKFKPENGDFQIKIGIDGHFKPVPEIPVVFEKRQR